MQTYTVSHADCVECGGRIRNHPVSAGSHLAKGIGEVSWAHQRREDWVDNVHQAKPKEGTIRKSETAI